MSSLVVRLTILSGLLDFSLRALAAETLCSCSPIEYQIRLDFKNNCNSSSTTLLGDNDGINSTLCLFGEGETANDASVFLGPDGRRGLLRKNAFGNTKLMLGTDDVEKKNSYNDGIDYSDSSNSLLKILQQLDWSTLSRHGAYASHGRSMQEASKSSLISAIAYVTSVLFLEVDTSPELNILQQDSTYFKTNLTNNAILSYTSISKMLDSSMSLKDQMELVPGGVVMIMFGVDERGALVQNMVAWGYGGETYCESESLHNGDSIGWAVIDDHVPAQAEFCPKLADTTPITTTLTTISSQSSPTTTSETESLTFESKANKSKKAPKATKIFKSKKS